MSAVFVRGTNQRGKFINFPVLANRFPRGESLWSNNCSFFRKNKKRTIGA